MKSTSIIRILTSMVRAIFLMTLFLSAFCAKAQLAENSIEKMVLTQWTTDDGLLSNNLTSVTQSSDGFIWLSSFNGLHRFDGKEFKTFRKENLPLLWHPST